MSSYEVAPLFLIRAAGVPFDILDRLGTRETSALARELLTRRQALATARQAAERLLGSRESGLSGEASRAYRATLKTLARPVFPPPHPQEIEAFVAAAAALHDTETRLEQALHRELDASRRALLKEASEVLPPYLLFGAGSFGERVHDLLETGSGGNGALPPRNARARERERHLLLYLQRVCAKNDTFSQYGPSGWGTADGGSSGMQLAPQAGVAKRDAYLERWTAHAVAAAVNSDPMTPAPLQVPALEPYAFEALRHDVEQWPSGDSRERWLPILQELGALPAQFAGSDSVADRQAMLNDASIRLRALGAERAAGDRFLYAAANPIGEECFRECNLRLSAEVIGEVAEEAEPWIDLWRDVYAFVASRVAAGLRQILELSAPETRVMRLPAFLEACQSARLPLKGPGLVALATMAFLEVKAAFRQRLRPHLEAAEYELTREDCHVIRNSFEYAKFDEYTYPSADLQLSAESVEAVGRGDYQWILAELHPPPALLHHCMYWSCPDKAQLNAALARTTKGMPNFHFGFFAADFTAHTAVRIFDALPDLTTFVAAQRANPAWRAVDPAEAEVFIDADSGDVGVRAAGSGEYLGSFARAWVIPLGFHPFQFAMAPHTPRLRCGRVVVQRRTWTVTVDELAAGDYSGISRELVLAIEQLRAARDLPRHIYIRPTEQALRRSGAEGRDKDTKPVYIDLESYLFIEIFYRWLKKAGEVDVTEMLPGPDHLCWSEPDGRRTFELRTLVVPRS